MAPATIRTGACNFVNLGTLYSLSPACGCSALLSPGGPRIVFQEKLERHQLLAHLRIVNIFLRSWSQQYNKSLGAGTHTVLVGNYGTVSRPDHLTLKIYTPGSRIRHQGCESTASYFRPNPSGFCIYPKFNRIMKHIHHVSEIETHGPPRSFTTAMEADLAESMQNFRGVWLPKRNSILPLRESTKHAYKLQSWDSKIYNRILKENYVSHEVDKSRSHCGTSTRYFRSRDIATNDITRPHSQSIHNATFEATIQSSGSRIQEACGKSAHISLSAATRLPPNTASTNAESLILDPALNADISQSFREIRSNDSISGVMKKPSHKPSTITVSTSQYTANVPSSSVPILDYKVLQRTLAQVEESLSYMKKDRRVIVLEDKLRELKAELRRTKSIKKHSSSSTHRKQLYPMRHNDHLHPSGQDQGEKPLKSELVTNSYMPNIVATAKTPLSNGRPPPNSYRDVRKKSNDIPVRSFWDADNQYKAVKGQLPDDIIFTTSHLNSDHVTRKSAYLTIPHSTRAKPTMKSLAKDGNSRQPLDSPNALTNLEFISTQPVYLSTNEALTYEGISEKKSAVRIVSTASPTDITAEIFSPQVESPAQRQASQRRVIKLQEELHKIKSELVESIKPTVNARKASPSQEIVDESMTTALKKNNQMAVVVPPPRVVTWGKTFSAASSVHTADETEQKNKEEQVSRSWLLSWLASAPPKQENRL